MVEQTFSDGIGTISITGGTVRLDLITFSPIEKDANGQPKAVFQQRIVMTADAFMHSAEKVQEAAQVLMKMAANVRPPAGVKTETESLMAVEPHSTAVPPPSEPPPGPSTGEPVRTAPPPRRPFP